MGVPMLRAVGTGAVSINRRLICNYFLTARSVCVCVRVVFCRDGGTKSFRTDIQTKLFVTVLGIVRKKNKHKFILCKMVLQRILIVTWLMFKMNV
jgi:hypothetical protein